MAENNTDRFFRWATLAIVLAVIATGWFVVIAPALEQNGNLKLQSAELDRKLALKEREEAELIDNQKRFATDADFVERIARMNRRVFPGELVFRFPGGE